MAELQVSAFAVAVLLLVDLFAQLPVIWYCQTVLRARTHFTREIQFILFMSSRNFWSVLEKHLNHAGVFHC